MRIPARITIFPEEIWYCSFGRAADRRVCAASVPRRAARGECPRGRGTGEGFTRAKGVRWRAIALEVFDVEDAAVRPVARDKTRRADDEGDYWNPGSTRTAATSYLSDLNESISTSYSSLYIYSSKKKA